MNSGTELIVAGTETIVGIKLKDKIESQFRGGDPEIGSEATHSITVATSEPNDRKGVPGEAKDKLGKSRGFLWTLYDYERHVPSLREEATKAEYMVWGYEICPDTKRPHLQGFVYYENQHSLGKFSRKYNNCRVHINNGSPQQNANYCKKPETKDPQKNPQWEEYGVCPHQGRRTDWEKAVHDIKSGVDISDVIEAQPQLVVAQRALREYKAMILKPKHREVNVVVLWGRGGTGKTRWAYEQYPDIFTKPSNKSSGSWWDGYSGQKEVLLDDYYGGIAYHEFLRVTDRYPYSAPICGSGYVWAQWDTIVITSNNHPRYWYQKQWGWPLRRRLNKIIKVSVIDGTTSYEEEEFPANEEAWLAEEETYIEA